MKHSLAVALFLAICFAIGVFAVPTLAWISTSADEHGTSFRTQFWEGYYHSAVNYRFYLRKVEQCPEKSALYQDFAQQWKQLETRWQNARDSQGEWSEEEQRGRLAELEARKDDIEAREPCEAFDRELVGEVQRNFDRFIGFDRKTGKYK